MAILPSGKTMEPEKNKITDNWDETKKALVDGLTGTKRAMIETVHKNLQRYHAEEEARLAKKSEPMTEEEEADEIIRRLKTPSPKITEDFRNVILPMIKRVMPATIANDIMSVQPMTGPVGEIRTLKHRYGKEETPDDEGTGS